MSKLGNNEKMAKKKLSRKNIKKKTVKKFVKKKPLKKRTVPSRTLDLKKDHDIATDIAVKIYKKFDKVVKSIILFGSSARKETMAGSDIDIVIVIDDASVKWDQELIAWYRQELGKILKANRYNKELHINTVKLTTWWEDVMKGNPVIINVIRYGEPLIDFGGFFEPLKRLLIEGKIRSSPEAIYSALQRAPMHLTRSRQAELSAFEGVYWAMVDSAHAALIAANVLPPSPEHIPTELRTHFVSAKMLKGRYIDWYREVLDTHKKISHGVITEIKGIELDKMRDKAEEFLNEMARIVMQIVKSQ